jgi:hypothetical protein
MLSAPVPRNLRVRSSIQVASARVPARAFLIAAGLIFGGGVLIVAGADVVRTAKVTSALIIIGLLIFEFRCWGRSMSEVVRILIRHTRRPRRLRLEPRIIVLPPETSTASAPRRPRWQT